VTLGKYSTLGSKIHPYHPAVHWPQALTYYA